MRTPATVLFEKPAHTLKICFLCLDCGSGKAWPPGSRAEYQQCLLERLLVHCHPTSGVTALSAQPRHCQGITCTFRRLLEKRQLWKGVYFQTSLGAQEMLSGPGQSVPVQEPNQDALSIDHPSCNSSFKEYV